MTPRHSKLAVSVFALLGVGVAVNVLLLQTGGPPKVASRQTPDRAGVATGSVERLRRPGSDRAEERQPAAKGAAALPDPRSKTDPKRPTEPSRTARAGAEAHAAAPAVADAAASDGPEVAQTVAAIQRELQARGYEPGTADGVPGLVTRAAIMAFEHDNAMPLTGEPSEPMLRAVVIGASQQLIAAHAAILTREKRQRAEQVIRTVQQSLIGIGYNSGKVSGRVSEDTERAIREFETDQGLAPTGRISGALVAKLAKAAGNGRLASGQ